MKFKIINIKKERDAWKESKKVANKNFLIVFSTSLCDNVYCTVNPDSFSVPWCLAFHKGSRVGSLND